MTNFWMPTASYQRFLWRLWWIIPWSLVAFTISTADVAHGECTNNLGGFRSCGWANTIEQCNNMLGCQWTAFQGNVTCFDLLEFCDGACSCSTFPNKVTCEAQFSCFWKVEGDDEPNGPNGGTTTILTVVVPSVTLLLF